MPDLRNEVFENLTKFSGAL